MEALSVEIKSLLTGPMKGKRTGVGELRKKMEAQSDAQVSALKLLEQSCSSASGLSCRCCCRLDMKTTYYTNEVYCTYTRLIVVHELTWTSQQSCGASAEMLVLRRAKSYSYCEPLPGCACLVLQVNQKDVVGALQQLAADGHVSYNERSQTVIARGT